MGRLRDSGCFRVKVRLSGPASRGAQSEPAGSACEPASEARDLMIQIPGRIIMIPSQLRLGVMFARRRWRPGPGHFNNMIYSP